MSPRSDTPRSLVWATDLDVLPAESIVVRRDGYLVARSPTNPTHYWGNLLLYDDPPADGDAQRWERAFEAEFGSDPRVRHRTFCWDSVAGELGRAREEFLESGYDLEQTVGLIAPADEIRPHPRENREVVVAELQPEEAEDREVWEQVIELQVAARDARLSEDTERTFTGRRLQDLRTLFRAGRGGWYVALDRVGGQVVGSCGVVVTGDRGRFQSVDTAVSHRRRGICSRLVVEAAQRSAARYGARRMVIAADPGYHALGLYQSLGFQPIERVTGVCRAPG